MLARIRRCLELLGQSRRSAALAGLLIALLTLTAYLPALRGGFVWDDDDYVTENATLRERSGLRQIWLEVGATPQYYPLVQTTFWLEYRLWGPNPFGYHLVNIVLHALGAVLLWRVLVQLQVPGAWLAAAIFALHPVHVESVAWITERKNVLSAVFYFAAAVAYLRFAPLQHTERRPRWHLYFLSLGLFIAALLSKTVTCSLPAALLLVAWWKTGRLTRRDIALVLPLLAVGVALGLHTAWVERHVIGARGADWSLGWLDRCLVAGRALWFYAGKLVWPVNLTFIYPRWDIDPRQWWQLLFPLAAPGAVAVLWLARHRIGRGPLVAVLFFSGTLAPALGFLNVYFMRYAFVADHFQYLASAGLIALAAVWLRQWPRVAWLAVLLLLGVLTWRQARIYADVETLWRDTLAKNPSCWMAHNHLGIILASRGESDAALGHFERALRVKPDFAEALNNAGSVLLADGRGAEAVDHFERAVRADPEFAGAFSNLGVALFAEGRAEEGLESFRTAVSLEPHNAEALVKLGDALVADGQDAEATGPYQASLRLIPDQADVHFNLGGVLARLGRRDEARVHFAEAARLEPDYAAPGDEVMRAE